MTGLDLARARTAALDPEEFSPLGAEPLLLLDADALLPALSAAEQGALAAALGALPCPVIAVGAVPPGPLCDACDVLLDRADQAPPLLRNIRRAPLAASVLVQLLRASEALPVETALLMESLAYATLQAGPEFRRWLAARPAVPDAPAEGPPLRLDRIGDRLDIRLDQPERRNAVSVAMRDALVEAFDLAHADSSIRSVWVSGAGRCFSIGGDLAEFGTAPDPATGHAVRSLRLPARALIRCADRVTARLHGACIGAGIELPAFARRVVARSDAFFQLPELGFGLIPGAGGTVSLPRRIGRRRTAWLALGGRRIPAGTALAWGLVDAVEDW